MLSGPANDYFSENHMRGGFTPNESSLRSGLTPGGSGSMFPASSPNSQALFAQLASGVATPNTIDFHRTALSAAAKREQSTSAAIAPAADMANGAAIKAEPKAFDPHDNDAANGLFLLAQGAQKQASAPAKGAAAKATGAANARGASEVSNASDELAKPNTRGKGKKGQPAAAASTRRKAEEPPAKAPPAKKAKGIPPPPLSDELSEDEDDDDDENGPRSKMTDEEKRKNFLERNRYVSFDCLSDNIFLANSCQVSPRSSVANARSSGSQACRTRWKCLAARTTRSLRKSRFSVKRLSTSRRCCSRTRTAL